MKRLFLMLPLMMLSFAAGCQTLTPKWPAWFSQEEKPQIEESKYPRPARMAVIWSPAMLNSPGKKPTRGFGGRVYFYDGQNKAVPVEGQLVVYGYNDTNPSVDSKSPDRKFAFTPEQFTTHYAPTELGASYSIWIPWDEVGNEQAEVSLVPIFTATSGQLVVGQSSKVVLPGPSTPVNPTRIDRYVLPPPIIENEMPGGAGAVQPAQYVQQASYQQQPAITNQSLGGIQETSIRLPTTMAERLASAPPLGVTLGPVSSPSGARFDPNFGRLPAPNSVPGAMGGPTANYQATSPAIQPPLARSGPPARPAPFSPAPQPTRGRLPTPPYPAAPPFGPPSAPPANPQTASPEGW